MASKSIILFDGWLFGRVGAIETWGGGLTVCEIGGRFHITRVALLQVYTDAIPRAPFWGASILG